VKAGLDRDRVALAAVTVTNVRLGEENDDLRRVVAAQAEEIARLQALVERLTEQVGAVLAAQTGGDDGAGATARPTTMPGLKPKPKRAPERPTRPRQRRARAYGRRRSLPTQRQVHAMACCPHCQTILPGGTIRRTREVIEIAPSPLVVTEHVYVERRCPRCRGRWLPEPGLGAVVVGQGRLGVGVLSRIAVLREEFRLPVAAIQRLLELDHGLCLSVGAIVGAAHTVAQQADAAVARIWAAVRASPVVHVDETGWREAGQNG
jgi:transposase